MNIYIYYIYNYVFESTLSHTMLNSLVYSSFSLSFVVVVFFFGSGKELAVEYYFAIDFVLIFVLFYSS